MEVRGGAVRYRRRSKLHPCRWRAAINPSPSQGTWSSAWTARDNHRAAAEVKKLKAKWLGLLAIARELKMPPSSVHKALQLAA
jgi:hypothetical protein